MNVELTSTQRKAAAIGLLLVVVWLLLELTAFPLVTAYREYNSEFDSLLKRFEVYSRHAAERDALRTALAQSARVSNSTDGYLRAATAPLASAELQANVKRLVQQRNGQLVSVQTLPVAEEEGFPRVAIRVHMRCSVECLQQMFYQLETGRPQLFLDSVVLSAPLRARGGNEADQLDADFHLSGYLRGKG